MEQKKKNKEISKIKDNIKSNYIVILALKILIYR